MQKLKVTLLTSKAHYETVMHHALLDISLSYHEKIDFRVVKNAETLDKEFEAMKVEDAPDLLFMHIEDASYPRTAEPYSLADKVKNKFRKTDTIGLSNGYTDSRGNDAEPHFTYYFGAYSGMDKNISELIKGYLGDAKETK